MSFLPKILPRASSVICDLHRNGSNDILGVCCCASEWDIIFVANSCCLSSFCKGLVLKPRDLPWDSSLIDGLAPRWRSDISGHNIVQFQSHSVSPFCKELVLTSFIAGLRKRSYKSSLSKTMCDFSMSCVGKEHVKDAV
uniref:Uncharacterized protein LOC113784415 isoform X2 n=1 Tax=Cicer arietinum TaxID=3827 RepID=A0A3Q7YBA5_CICAR|nr:uncharacterized protein LOC113784415 isoform X2 [Cicer arietinum]